MTAPLDNRAGTPTPGAPAYQLSADDRVRLVRVLRRARRNHVGGPADGALTLAQWRALAFLRWRMATLGEHAEPREPQLSYDELHTLTSALGTYLPVGKPEAVKRYVDPAARVDDTCEFPNLVYRGHCEDASGKWKAEWCVYIPGWAEDWFGARAAGRLRLLRWLIQRGDYDADLSGEPGAALLAPARPALAPEDVMP